MANAKILIVSWGSRGDVQPCVALALRLQELGFRVKVLVGDQYEMNHVEFVRSFSVDAESYPCILDFDADGLMAGRETNHFFDDVDSTPEQFVIYSQVKSFMPALLLYPPRHALVAWVIEKRLAICTIQFNFHWDQASIDFARGTMKDMVKKEAQLAAHLGVRSLDLDFAEVAGRAGISRPILYAVSGEVVAHKPDWPLPSATAGIHTPGFWVLDESLQNQARASKFFGGPQNRELSNFLSSSPGDVIYIGWGSMHVVSREFMAQLAVRTLRVLQKRGIILGSYIQLGRDALFGARDEHELRAYADKNVLWLQWAPHEWLMPRCSVIVHHGGCGTTAASLRAGRPTVITPTAFDQSYWGRQMEQRGVGVATEHLSGLTAAGLAAAVRACDAPTVRQKAAGLGERLRKEDGASRTAKWLSSYMKAAVRTGEWKALRADPAMRPASAPNLALGRPVRASSCKSAERDAAFAVDGQQWTRWTSTYSDNQWLAIDLGETHSLSSVEICWEVAHAKSYLLQGSPDGASWTTLASEAGREGWVLTQLPANSRARWVRMYGQQRATQWGFSIWEMRVHG